uniref:Uncharacterized protein n=1 Tax=Arundo donax TaxID=35708 RepID=A0A0A8YEM8_ARUDO
MRNKYGMTNSNCPHHFSNPDSILTHRPHPKSYGTNKLASET